MAYGGGERANGGKSMSKIKNANWERIENGEDITLDEKGAKNAS